MFTFATANEKQRCHSSLQPQTRNNGAIAQLVEQRTENPCVPGSIPGGTTEILIQDLSQDFLFIKDYKHNTKQIKKT